jgi:hypothetical protein
MLTIEQLKKANKTKKLKIVNNGDDHFLYLGEEKVAILFRNINQISYIIGFYFELKDYEPIEVSCVQEGAFEIKHYLNSVGVECDF